MSDQESSKVTLASDEIKKLSLHEKITKVMEHVKYVQKNSTVSTGNDRSYKAVTHDDVTAKLHDFVAAYGITIVPEMIDVKIHEVLTEKKYQNTVDIKRSYRADVWVEVEFTNAHNKDDHFKKKWFAYAMDSMDKATGKAVSMAVKFCYLKTFMLESGDDEESRDFENSFNYNPNQNRNTSNHAGNNRGNPNGTTSSRSNGNNANNQNTGKEGNKESSGQKIEASENQIKAIAKICETKKLEVGEKFKSPKTCSSQEAGEEIKRLSAIKA